VTATGEREPDPLLAATDPLERAKDYYRTQARARAELAAEDWTAPADDGSLKHQLDNPEPDPDMVVANIIPAESNVVVAAQWKAGKTTLGFNLAADLADGKDWLGHYPTALPTGSSVGYWNVEIGKAQAQRWFDDLKIAHPERIHPLHLRGHGVPLGSPHGQDWAVGWLRERQVAVWVIDPYGAIYQGEENSNSEVREWTKAVDAIKARAGVSVLVVMAHTKADGGDSGGDARPKARGATRLTDWADVLVGYRHDGALGDQPDGARYLSAVGRDVNLPDATLAYDPATRRLTVGGAPRGQAKVEEFMQKATQVVMERGSISVTELKERVGGKKETQHKALDQCVSWGWLAWEKKGNSKIYSIGPTPLQRPSVQLHVVREAAAEDAG
jgi:hypothetical protein